MPQFVYLEAACLEVIDEILGPDFFLLVPLLITLLLGLLMVGAILGPRRASLLFGLAELVIGLVSLAGLLATAPHLWWAAAIPIAAGVATLRARSLHAAGQSWFRFGLVDLFALMLIGGLLLAGITAMQRQTAVELAAADQLARLPGGNSNQVQWRLGRVREVLFFSTLNPASFEAAADALEKFSQLRNLQIGDNTLPGSALQRIGRLTTLRSFNSQSLPVTDDDLRFLSTLSNLESLDLDGQRLTDAGLVHLQDLKRLRLLHLYNTKHGSPKAMAELRAKLPLLDK